MDIQLSRGKNSVENFAILNLEGRLDSFNYESLKDKVNTLLKMGNVRLVLDLSSVNFIAVPTLIFIIKLSKQLKKKPKGQLYALNLNSDLKDHFEKVRGLESVVCISSLTEIGKSNKVSL